MSKLAGHSQGPVALLLWALLGLALGFSGWRSDSHSAAYAAEAVPVVEDGLVPAAQLARDCDARTFRSPATGTRCATVPGRVLVMRADEREAQLQVDSLTLKPFPGTVTFNAGLWHDETGFHMSTSEPIGSGPCSSTLRTRTR